MASISIPAHYNEKFNDDIRILSQQVRSRLMAICDRSMGMLQADKGWYKFIGQVEAEDDTTRYGDTPVMEAAHTSRQIQDFRTHVNVMLDPKDRHKIVGGEMLPMLYTQLCIAGLNRRIDREIIRALGASVIERDDHTMVAKTKAFPSGNVVAAGAKPLTMAKIRETNKKLLDAEAKLDPGVANNGDQRFWLLVSSQQYAIDLLATLEIGSFDYNAFRAFQAGEVNNYMGFAFLYVGDMLPLTGNVRTCYALSPRGIGLVDTGIDGQIDVRPDKSYAIQTYCERFIGATRLEDAHVVKIECDESQSVDKYSAA